MAQKATVRGTAQLRRKINKLKASVRGEALERAASKGGDKIREAAARRAPQSPGGPTRGGQHLKDNIITEVTPTHNPEHGQVGIGPHEDAFHGIFFTREFGAPHHSPQPWLRPAFDRKRSAAVDAVGDELARIIRTAAALTR